MTSNKKISINEALNEAQLGSLHWRVWFLSSMGVFLDGFDLFIIGIALPLIVREFNPGPIQIGFIGSAAVLVQFWVVLSGVNLLIIMGENHCI